jgi:methionyl-tRNA formyltransferase
MPVKLQKLRIVFMGTPAFAVASLDTLLKNGYDIAAVITAPDKASGRGLEIHQSPVKKYALEKNLKVLQPEKLKDPQFLSDLKELDANLQVVVAFRMLPEIVWRSPTLGTINLHASLLPQYRGAAPINWAIINGEKETGLSTFFLKQEIDTGKIISRVKVPISENDTAGELHDRLMSIGAELLLETVQKIENQTYTGTEQDQFLKSGEKPKSAPKIFKEDCKINWNRSVTEIHDHIRGLSPYPAAFTEIISPDGKQLPLKIFKANKEVGTPSSEMKTISSDSKTYLKVAAKDGYIIIHELQLAGKKRMNVSEFLRGFPLPGHWIMS